MERRSARGQGRLRATSFHYQTPNLVDARLGRILRLQPEDLQRRIQAAYGSSYDLEYGYGSGPARGCHAEFASRNKRVKLFFGLIPQRPSRPYLVFSHGY